MRVTLRDILPKASQEKRAIAAFNIFSIDWARACTAAAEELNSPLILMTNKAMVEHYPLSWLGAFLSDIAHKAAVPICIHLDHCRDFDIIKEAIKSGYSSVMYDGSYLSLEENIKNTKQIVQLAHDKGCSIEGEVGSVAYTDIKGTRTEHTKVTEAKEFSEKTNIDALAISIGSIHRSTEKNANIDYSLLKDIQKEITTPLVMHGTTSLKDEDILKLKKTQFAKFNIGTSLRLAYANEMRKILTTTNIFDPLQLDNLAYKAVKKTAKKTIIQLDKD